MVCVDIDIVHRKTISVHSRAVAAIAYSPNGDLIAAASADERASIWRSADGSQASILEGEHHLGLNGCCWVDQHLLATASDDKTVHLWDVERGRSVLCMNAHKSFVYSITSNPYNHLILTGGYDGSIKAYDPVSGKCVIDILAHSEPVGSLCFSPSGNEIVSGGQDGLVRVWDSCCTDISGCLMTVYSEKAPPVANVGFSPNGEYLLISTMDDTHRIYNCKELGGGSNNSDKIDCYLSPLKEFTGHRNSRHNITSVLYPHQSLGPLLVSGSEDNHVYIWNLNNSKMPPKMLSGHNDVVMAIACHPDASFLQIASAGKDGAVKLWGTHDAPFGGDDENKIDDSDSPAAAAAAAMDVDIERPSSSSSS